MTMLPVCLLIPINFSMHERGMYVMVLKPI
jgi:hypothetical protein